MSETERDPAAASDPASFLVGVIAAQVIGGLITQLSPFVIGGLMAGLALSERDAGLVSAVEFVTLACTASAIAPLLPQLSFRRAALLAVALALLADAASIFSVSWTSFALLRGVAGIGEGALYAVSLSVVACRSSNADKVYGYFQVVWALASVAFFSVGGELTAAFAYRGILAMIVGVTLLLAPCLLLIPEARAPIDARSAPDDATQTSPLLGVTTLAAIALYVSVSDAVYAFSAPLGALAGLDTRAVGYVLTVSSLVGLVGAGGAAAVNVRWGRALPISGFCASFSAAVVVLCLCHRAAQYIAALAVSFVVFYFSIPYLFGLAAALDRRGRWAAAAGSAYLAGFAAGPAMAGAVIGVGGYAGLGAFCVAITAAVWALFMLVNRRLTRTRSSPELLAPRSSPT